MNSAARLSLSIAALLLAGSSAQAEIYLNEVVVRGTERVELYNSGSDSVSLTGWTLEETGVFLIPDGTIIAPGEYLVLDDLGGIMHDIGGDLDLIDELPVQVGHHLAQGLFAIDQPPGAPAEGFLRIDRREGLGAAARHVQALAGREHE